MTSDPFFDAVVDELNEEMRKAREATDWDVIELFSRLPEKDVEILDLHIERVKARAIASVSSSSWPVVFAFFLGLAFWLWVVASNP